MGNFSKFDAPEVVSFGPFQLSAFRRVLLEGGCPVQVGSRAFALLVALINRAGEVVSRSELLASAWPEAVVSDANLCVQISALRRMLGDGQDGRRYVVNVPGRGYSFVAPVVRSADSQAAPRPSAHPARHNLPAHRTCLVGRTAIIADLVGRLEHRQLVTIAGTGGVGKTAVALRVAEETLPAHADGAWFIDLAPVADAAVVTSALARVLSLPVQDTNDMSTVVDALAERRMLLVFDNCEHVIEAVATLVTVLLHRARGVRILATSREPLRIKGEQVVRMPPLASPEPGEALDGATALTYPAVQLFVERAGDAAAGFDLLDTDAARVGEICHRLDGIPLAIELAAARLDLVGVNALAARPVETLRAHSIDHTGLLARQSTSQAVVEWSYRLLDASEQAIFRRLAVFVGGFTLEAAQAVISQGQLTVDDVEMGLDSLVSKSLVIARGGDHDVRFMMPETTRVYALSKLREHFEFDELGQRHARWLVTELAAARNRGATPDQFVEVLASEINNLRAALGWSLGKSGDAALGHQLCASSIPLWRGLSMLSECRAWVKIARDKTAHLRGYAGWLGTEF